MSDDSHNTITVSVGAVDISWTVQIDLDDASYRVFPPREGSSPQPIAKPRLKRLRTEAEAAQALGDFKHREQFADGRVDFTIKLAGQLTTLSYETWGGGQYQRVRQIWDFARAHCGK